MLYNKNITKKIKLHQTFHIGNIDLEYSLQFQFLNFILLDLNRKDRKIKEKEFFF